MELTPAILMYALLAYSVVFSVIGLFFFAYSISTVIRVKEMIESVINLISRYERRQQNEIEG